MAGLKQLTKLSSPWSAAAKHPLHVGTQLRRIQFAKASLSQAENSRNKEPWKMKMLYDGECPLCMREVNMLRKRNESYKAINFVDISSADYSPEENSGIDYETAMGRIHAISSDGKVFTNVQAFKKLYEAVGLGWVYAITNYEPFSSLAEAVYSVWARYRLPITGRPPLIEVLEAKQKNKQGPVCKP